MNLTDAEKRLIQQRREQAQTASDADSALIGGVVGAVTNSGVAGAVVGGLVGGSIVGGILGGIAGDFLNGGSLDD